MKPPEDEPVGSDLVPVAAGRGAEQGCHAFAAHGPAELLQASGAAKACHPAQSDDPRLTRALEEYLSALEHGQAPNRQEFLQRYPDIATPLAECLDGLEFVNAVAPQLPPSALSALPPRVGEGTGGGATAATSAGDIQAEIPLGDYRIVRQIGRGGMGVVYEAVQLSLGRRVALKVLPFAAALDSKQLQRFKNEAHAAAHLQHQNIVPVYAVGCERGVHFYAMQFVEGQTLAALIQELRQLEGREDRESKMDDRGSKAEKALGAGLPTPPRNPTAGLLEPTGPYAREENKGARLGDRERDEKEANTTIEDQAAGAETLPAQPRSSILDPPSSFFRTVVNLGIQAAEALEHAHQLGVIHRDIKPANLMVDARGNLWITDFGLAHCQGGVELTMSGDLLGTLRYMSPEQALAKRVIVDERTDIYSLGVTLYELLSLEPAFPGTDRQEVLRQIAFDDPKPPRRWNKAIPMELETIILKAMEKNPADRYGTAKEMADDLHRYLDDKPIRARRPTLMQRFRKWARRHPGVVRTSASALVVLVLALAVSNVWITRLSNQKDDALREKGVALVEKDDALAKAEEQARLALEQQKLAEKAERTGRRRFYAAQMNLAQHAWEAGEPDRVLELLEGQRPKFDQEDLRGFDWYYLWRLCHSGCRLRLPGHTVFPCCLIFSPDGKTLASGSWDGTAKLWDMATGQERITLRHKPGFMGLAFSPDGRTLASANNGGDIYLWDAATGQKQTTLQGDQDGLRSVAFSPDGKTLAAGSELGTAVLWDLAKRQQRAVLRGHKGPVISVAFTPDGKALATDSGWGEPKEQGGALTILWDLTAEPVRSRLKIPNGYGLAISPDGEILALGSGLTLFDVKTGKERIRFQGPMAFGHTLALSPDGKILASASEDKTVRLWDVATGQERRRLPHAAVVQAVAISPDGKTLAAGGDGVTLWDLEPPPEQNSQNLGGVPGFLPDGKHLIAAGQQTRVWDLAAEQVRQDQTKELLRLPVSPDYVAISPDGKLLASSDVAGVKLWDLATGQLRASVPAVPGVPAKVQIRRIWPSALAFSPDGKLLASADGAGVKLWDVAAGQLRTSVPAIPGGPAKALLMFSPDGKTLVMDSTNSSLRLWDVATQKVRATLANPTGEIWPLAFSPNGKYLAAGGWGGWVQLWDVATGQPRAKFTVQPSAHTFNVRFSPDSKTLASSDTFGTVMFWDVDSGQLQASLQAHSNYIIDLAFSPDGKTFATASQDTTIKLWDVATGQERLTLKGHKAALAWAFFSPDGSQLVSTDIDGITRVWRAATDAEATAFKPDLDAVDPGSPVVQNDFGDRLRAEGRPQEAEAVYRQAEACLGKLVSAFPNVPAYRQELARSHEGLEQWDQAVAELSKAIELQPGMLEPRLRRAEFYTRHGRWEQAAADWEYAADDFAKADEFAPELAYWHALARLGARDLARYRATCADLLEHFGTSPDPDVAHWVAWTCILAPDAVKDFHQPVQIAERAVRADPKNLRNAGTLGAALYRAGRFGEAIKELNEAGSGSAWMSPAYPWFFLAMANYRLGQAQEAHKWLDKAVKQMEQEIQNKGVTWNRRLTLHLFRREAEHLLKGPAKPNQKPE